MPQDIVWGDGPELAASAWTLGVPHPTGYSSYMLGLRLFQWLPLGTVAFRSNLFSAVCMALAVVVLFSFLKRSLRGWYGERLSLTVLPAFCATLACFLTPVVWSQSVIAEVYALFILQFALGFYLLGYLVDDRRSALAPLLFLSGWMMVHHRLSVFLLFLAGGLYLFILLWRLRTPKSERGEKLKFSPMYLLFLIIPLLCLLYFPFRAMQDPPVNWFDPDVFDRFVELNRGGQFGGIISFYVLMNLKFHHLIVFVLPLLSYSFLAIPALYGFYVLINREYWLGYSCFFLFFVHQVFLLIYAPGDWQVFLLPATVVVSAPLAWGIAEILFRIQQWDLSCRLYSTILVGIVLVSALPLFVIFDEMGGLIPPSIEKNPFPLSFQSAYNRFAVIGDTNAADYGRQVWTSVPPGVPILTGFNSETADNEYYPLLYQQVVERCGEETALIGAGFLLYDWYRRQANASLALDLVMRGGRYFLSKEAWLENMWGTVLQPCLDRGPVTVTTYPLPALWYQSAYVEDLVNQNVIDLSYVPRSYRFYIPKGHVLLLTSRNAKNPVGE